METEKRIGGNSRRRAFLRAVNGVGLAALLGGALGCAFAVVYLVPTSRYTPDWIVGGIYGFVLGVVGGALIGPTMAVRSHRRAWWAAVAIGLAEGCCYHVLPVPFTPWSGWEGHSNRVLAVGVLGAGLLGALLRAIRVTWGWWSRWDDEPEGLPAGQSWNVLAEAARKAGLGAFAGGVLAFSLGGLYAFVMIVPTRWGLLLGPAQWGLGAVSRHAVHDVPAGIIGGAAIGLGMTAYNQQTAWWSAAGIGLAVGCFCSVLLDQFPRNDVSMIGVSILVSGPLGSASFGVFLRAVRAKWGWPLHWDVEPAVLPPA